MDLDFDPRDLERDEARDIDMPWIELGRGPGSAREEDDPRDRDDYAKAVLRWLKPAGNYLAVNYLIPDTDGPPFGTTREDLMKRFLPHCELLAEWVPRSYPNRTGLELMLWWKRKGCG